MNPSVFMVVQRFTHSGNKHQRKDQGKKLITPPSKQCLTSTKKIRNKETNLNLVNDTKRGVFPLLKHHPVLGEKL